MGTTKKRKTIDTGNGEYDNDGFIKFDDHKDKEFHLTGIEPYVFKSKTDGDVDTFLATIEGKRHILPTHYQLQKKIKAVLEIEKKTECFVKYTGIEKHPTDRAKTIAQYTVETEE